MRDATSPAEMPPRCLDPAPTATPPTGVGAPTARKHGTDDGEQPSNEATVPSTERHGRSYGTPYPTCAATAAGLCCTPTAIGSQRTESMEHRSTAGFHPAAGVTSGPRGERGGTESQASVPPKPAPTELSHSAQTFRNEREMAGSNREAVDTTLTALEADGKLGGASEALVQLVRSLADSVDRDPQNASLWREYRGAVSDLLKLGANDGDAFTDLVTRLRAPLGDTPN